MQEQTFVVTMYAHCHSFIGLVSLGRGRSHSISGDGSLSSVYSLQSTGGNHYCRILIGSLMKLQLAILLYHAVRQQANSRGEDDHNSVCQYWAL